MRGACSTSPARSTCSNPAPRGGSSVRRVSNPRPSSTAVTVYPPPVRVIICSIALPSLEKKAFSSIARRKKPVTARICGTAAFAAAADSTKSATLVFTGTRSGSFSMGVSQVSSCGGSGASCTGRRSRAAFASAISAALRARAPAERAVTSGPAANPHVPFFSTRTPMP